MRKGKDGEREARKTKQEEKGREGGVIGILYLSVLQRGFSTQAPTPPLQGMRLKPASCLVLGRGVEGQPVCPSATYSVAGP